MDEGSMTDMKERELRSDHDCAYQHHKDNHLHVHVPTDCLYHFINNIQEIQETHQQK